MGASEAHHPQPLRGWRRGGEDAHHLKKPDLHVCQLPGNTHSFYLYPDRLKPTQGPSVTKEELNYFSGAWAREQDNRNR